MSPEETSLDDLENEDGMTTSLGFRLNLDNDRIRQYLPKFAFKDLFIDELGWDSAWGIPPLPLIIDQQEYTLNVVTVKRSVVVLLYQSPGDIPQYVVRRKIDREVAERYHEHLIIFVDRQRTKQLWQWARRELGRPLAIHSHVYSPTQPADSLIQKLKKIAFSLEEEDYLSVVDVSGRLRAAFNVERRRGGRDPARRRCRQRSLQSP